MQAYKTANKSTSEALKCVRAWAANWGLPYSVKINSGPAFCQTWQDKLVERSVRTLKRTAKEKYKLIAVTTVKTCREL